MAVFDGPPAAGPPSPGPVMTFTHPVSKSMGFTPCGVIHHRTGQHNPVKLESKKLISSIRGEEANDYRINWCGLHYCADPIADTV